MGECGDYMRITMSSKTMTKAWRDAPSPKSELLDVLAPESRRI